MYAVIQTGGKQYKVKEGETLKVEKLDIELGKTIDLDALLIAMKKVQPLRLAPQPCPEPRLKPRLLNRADTRRLK